MHEQIIDVFYHAAIDLDFENIFSYCKFAESSLKQEKEKFHQIYQQKTDQMSDEGKKELEHILIEMHWKLYDVFPNLLWNSVFNTAYATFENHLTSLCNIFEKGATHNIKLGDLSGKGIEKAKIYLSKVIGIKNVFNSTEWEEIKNASKVRNILAHTSGKLDLNNSKHNEVFLYAQNSHHKIIGNLLDPGSKEALIIITPEYIYDTLLNFRIILRKICEFK